MDAGQLMQSGMKLILMFSPFLLVFLAITYANELIGLIYKAVNGVRRGWD